MLYGAVPSFLYVKDIYIVNTNVCLMENDRDKLYRILNEELSKADVNSMIASKLSSSYNSREFKSAVKELSADVVNELFKLLWQRNNFWKTGVSRA